MLRALALSALLAPLPLAAQTLDCSDPGNLPQQQMNACARLDYEAADAALNATWDEAIARARAIGAGEELLAAQRLWLPYRDAACAAEAAVFEGGTLAPFLLNSCLAELTRRRTGDLQIWVDMEF